MKYGHWVFDYLFIDRPWETKDNAADNDDDDIEALWSKTKMDYILGMEEVSIDENMPVNPLDVPLKPRLPVEGGVDVLFFDLDKPRAGGSRDQ